MRISHEAIYQALYIEGRGALKRGWSACLRTGRALPKPRERCGTSPKATSPPTSCSANGPAEAEDRAVPGTGRATSSSVEPVRDRHRGGAHEPLHAAVHLPRLDGYGTIAPVKNGPALAGYGAVAMKDALAATMTTMPAELLRSLTWDRGKDCRACAVQDRHGIAVYFADPHSRGNAQRTGTPMACYASLPERHRPAPAGPTRTPRRFRQRSTADPAKVLDWKTPAEVLDEQLRSL